MVSDYRQENDLPLEAFRLTTCRLILENINGALPNQDLVNTVAHIAQWTAGVPVRLHSLSAEYVVPSSASVCIRESQS